MEYGPPPTHTRTHTPTHARTHAREPTVKFNCVKDGWWNERG
jgi:hypothetical protein